MQTKLTESEQKEVKERSKKEVKETPISYDVPLNTSINRDNIQYHKSHRYLFIFDYSGPQPTRGSDRFARVGRYRTTPQARYDYSEDKAIVFTLPNVLKIWIKHPEGIKTTEQLINARKTAWAVSNSFAHKHGIAILKERTAGFSEHTVESKPLDRVILRPIVENQPELAKEKLGLSINQTSHKNKVEWTGPKAKERVMYLEYILDGGLARDMVEIKDTLGELVKYSKKPPEKPEGHDFR
jgi:hypothetical protein